MGKNKTRLRLRSEPFTYSKFPDFPPLKNIYTLFLNLKFVPLYPSSPPKCRMLIPVEFEQLIIHSWKPLTGIKPLNLSPSGHCATCGIATMVFFLVCVDHILLFGLVMCVFLVNSHFRAAESLTLWGHTHRQEDHAVHPEGRVSGVER